MSESRNLFDPRMVMEINRNPLQFPGRDRHVESATVAGPACPGDRRVFLSVALLEQCLAAARASSTGRCTLDHAGVRVDLYEQRDGHRYEVWTLVGIGPRPEPLPGALGALLRPGAS